MSNKDEFPMARLVCTGVNNADKARLMILECIRNLREIGQVNNDDNPISPRNIDDDTVQTFSNFKYDKIKWDRRYGKMLMSIDKTIDEEIANYCAVSLDNGDLIDNDTIDKVRKGFDKLELERQSRRSPLSQCESLDEVKGYSRLNIPKIEDVD